MWLKHVDAQRNIRLAIDRGASVVPHTTEHNEALCFIDPDRLINDQRIGAFGPFDPWFIDAGCWMPLAFSGWCCTFPAHAGPRV